MNVARKTKVNLEVTFFPKSFMKFIDGHDNQMSYGSDILYGNRYRQAVYFEKKFLGYISIIKTASDMESVSDSFRYCVESGLQELLTKFLMTDSITLLNRKGVYRKFLNVIDSLDYNDSDYPLNAAQEFDELENDLELCSRFLRYCDPENFAVFTPGIGRLLSIEFNESTYLKYIAHINNQIKPVLLKKRIKRPEYNGFDSFSSWTAAEVGMALQGYVEDLVG